MARTSCTAPLKPQVRLRYLSGTETPRSRHQCALGTDGTANNRLSMLGELQTASLIGKSRTATKAVDAWTALEMATLQRGGVEPQANWAY